MVNQLSEDKQRAVARSVWGQYRTWDKGAVEEKSWHQTWRWVVLILTVAAMLAGPFTKTIEQQWPEVAKALVIVASALFALLAWTNKNLLGDDSHHPWVRKRALAEALKSLAFQFLGGVTPYGGADSGEVALKRAAELAGKGVGVPPQLKPEQLAEELPTIPLTAERYVQERVDDQARYFRKRATAEVATGKRVRVFGWIVGGLAVALGAFGASPGRTFIDVWVPAFSVIVTVITTQMVLDRRQFLAESYSAAAAKLELAKTSWEISDRQPADLQRLVAGAEAILVGENAAWVEQLMATPTPAGATKPPSGG